MAKYLKVVLLAILLTIVVSAGTEKSDVQVETAEEVRKEGEEGSESWTTWASGVGGYAADTAGGLKEGVYSTGAAVKENIASSYGAAKEKVVGGSQTREEEL